jgi:hypothetical protein
MRFHLELVGRDGNAFEHLEADSLVESKELEVDLRKSPSVRRRITPSQVR